MCVYCANGSICCKCQVYIYICENVRDHLNISWGGGWGEGFFVCSWPDGLYYVSHIQMHFSGCRSVCWRPKLRVFSRKPMRTIRFSKRANALRLAYPVSKLRTSSSGDDGGDWVDGIVMDTHTNTSSSYCCGCWAVAEEALVIISWESTACEQTGGLWRSEVIFVTTLDAAFRFDFRKNSVTIGRMGKIKRLWI